jgi:protocatechuate 4,5-dioxygenase, alpha chain
MRQAVEEAMLANDYDDIPGTFVFDAQRSRQGYGVNMFCMSLLKEENRQEFRAGEEEYLSRFPLTRAQKDAILHREWNRMLHLGGNVYFIAKLAATDGLSFSQVAAIMTGSTQQEYADMMLNGGRPVEGNRSKSDRNQHG